MLSEVITEEGYRSLLTKYPPEAVAAGVFPLGTYFAGMAAHIDALSRAVPAASYNFV